MRALFLNSLYDPHIGGGAEIILQQTVEGLQKRGMDVMVLATGPEKGLRLDRVNGVPVYRAGLSNLYWHHTQERPGRFTRLAWHIVDRYNARMRRYVREVIARECPDIVICHNLSGWSVSAWDEVKAADLPIVQVLHDMYLLCPRSTMFNQGKTCPQRCGQCQTLRQPHPQASQQVDAVIGVSRFLLDKLTANGYFGLATSHVIYNCSVVPKPTFRCERLPNAPLRFGYMGTLSDNKGVAWLIEEFQAQKGMHAMLYIAGRGQLDYVAHLKRLADPSRVRFIGYQSPQTFYSAIDVAVVPSRWAEPFGMVAVEACAHGVPVIATRMGGLSEIIQDRFNGLLCSPAQPESLGVALRTLHDDKPLRERLAYQARSSVSALLGQDRMLDEYETIIRQTVAKRKARA
ncbi:glycosyltransferase involved in cell wall biosynthesis [Pseudomonas duriflava]|uniref:Glycosyltransferase involved in cell wall biosynthesis n=1 Tax=Pseudomonas duriflava TaxID=459528 RepID=A0A562PSC2_9PSED|nr:glycosyltransferase family 4 protein [Pseudomonas duriflava]TWI47273.1 glycosyltransferase involved in cell wall biosynthesis [Pseudomonas duriflava]